MPAYLGLVFFVFGPIKGLKFNWSSFSHGLGFSLWPIFCLYPGLVLVVILVLVFSYSGFCLGLRPGLEHCLGPVLVFVFGFKFLFLINFNFVMFFKKFGF